MKRAGSAAGGERGRMWRHARRAWGLMGTILPATA